MKFSKTAMQKAEIELEKRRTLTQSTFDNHTLEIELKAPEIAQINQRLINTTVELSKAIIARDANITATIERIKTENLEGQKKIREMLVLFGYPADYLDIKPFCKKCNDTGFVEGIRCECFDELLKKYSIEELNRSCKIELRDFSDFHLEYYPDAVNGDGISPRQKMSDTLEYCKSWAESFDASSAGIFMYGKTGLGKTFLSSAIAKQLLSEGYSVAFDSITNFLREVENEHFGRSNNRDTLEILLDADLVILDDLGSEFTTPFNSSVIYNILNTRINRNVPTIVSTNYSLQELQQKYDDRIVSRLTCSLESLKFIGNDIRQYKRFNNIG